MRGHRLAVLTLWVMFPIGGLRGKKRKLKKNISDACAGIFYTCLFSQLPISF